MEDFIHRENLSLYRKKLAEVTDEATRHVIRKRLAEEQAKDRYSLGESHQKISIR